jgi:hypothetical protein
MTYRSLLLWGVLTLGACSDDTRNATDGGPDGSGDWGSDRDTDANPDESCSSTGADDSFSFFVTSMEALIALSGNSEGFGGDLRYNGAATGIAGADAICQEIARGVCFGHKTWRAFLSTTSEDAIDRVGPGPWYDHGGLLLADNTAGLTETRPAGGNHDDYVVDEMGRIHDGNTDYNNDGFDDDDHDVLTGSYTQGQLDQRGSNCDDWMSLEGAGPTVGHMWPGGPGPNWISQHSAPGCGRGINLTNTSRGEGGVGGSGGYGAFYCFALNE